MGEDLEPARVSGTMQKRMGFLRRGSRIAPPPPAPWNPEMESVLESYPRNQQKHNQQKIRQMPLFANPKVPNKSN